MTKKELTEKFANIRGISHITREFTPEEMTFAYVKGYECAIDIACQVLESLVMYRRNLFGRSEERVFDDDFIEKFRETTKIKE
jgi:hypothetical protein